MSWTAGFSISAVTRRNSNSDGVDIPTDIEDFHEKFGLKYDGPPRFLPDELQEFRSQFLQEELTEYEESLANGEIEKAFDALIDLVYVAVGTAYLHGFPFAEGWRRVQEANMKKVRAERTEQSLRGTTYDVVKPEGWRPPDLHDLVVPLSTAVLERTNTAPTTPSNQPPGEDNKRGTFYLAGRTGNRGSLIGLRARITALGYECTSRWLDNGDIPPTVGTAEWCRYALRRSAEDLKDIARAELFILDPTALAGSIPLGGMHVEFGYALATWREIYVMGSPQAIFYFDPAVRRCIDDDDLIRRLRERLNG